MEPIFQNKKERVYRALREEILAGRLAPGMRLVIDDLAARLDVSAIPVREALQQLQADQLVVIEPYVGARVAELHADLVQEVFAVLEALEVISSRAACLHLQEADFRQIQALLLEMDGQVDDVERWAQGNARLHLFLCEKARMDLVRAMMAQIQDHWHRVRRTYLTQVMAGRVAEAQREHWHLLQALRTGNPDHVEGIIRRHNQAALAAYLTHLASQTPKPGDHPKGALP